MAAAQGPLIALGPTTREIRLSGEAPRQKRLSLTSNGLAGGTVGMSGASLDWESQWKSVSIIHISYPK